MRIELRLYATLRRYAPGDAAGGIVYLEAEAGASVLAILALAAVPVGEVHLVMINGIHANLDTVLAEGDRVGLFPAVGGG